MKKEEGNEEKDVRDIHTRCTRLRESVGERRVHTESNHYVMSEMSETHLCESVESVQSIGKALPQRHLRDDCESRETQPLAIVVSIPKNNQKRE